MKRNIRELADQNISRLLQDFVDRLSNKENIMFHAGKVVNNNDPDQQGRCKIRVYGIHSNEIPDEDLPWAIPDFNFIGSTLGSFIVPPKESLVNVFFDNNDFYNPRYSTKVLQVSKLSDMKSSIDEDYPDTMTFFETDTGEYFKINRKTNVSVYQHASGVIIRIDSNGNCDIDSTGSLEGKITINTLGGITINSDGDLSLNSKGNIELNANADIKLKSTLGSIKLGGDSATSPLPNLPVTPTPGSPTFTPTMSVPGKSVLISL